MGGVSFGDREEEEEGVSMSVREQDVPSLSRDPISERKGESRTRRWRGEFRDRKEEERRRRSETRSTTAKERKKMRAS